MGSVDAVGGGGFAPFLIFLILILLVLGINNGKKY
jgi:hypothetical protein